MREIKNPQLFERKKEEFKKHIKSHILPSKKLNIRFQDGTSMYDFFYANREKLLQDKEIQEIIESKIKDEERKFTLAEEKIKQQEQAFLNLLEKKPKSFDKLNEIERLIFYRECFLAPEESKENYEIQNIKLNKLQLTTFKELYYNCYATYLEKEKSKGNNPLTEKIDKKELEKLNYLNTLCIQTNWNKDKINEISKAYNCTPEDIKNLVIKYNYLKLYPEITRINGQKKKQNAPTDFQTHQLNSTTIEEIANIYKPIQIKEYINYKESNGYNWKYLKKIEGLPADEIIKMIYNIQTKSNLFKQNLEKKQAEKRALLAEKQNKEKIEKAVKEAEALLILLENQDFSTTTEFCKNNNIKYNHIRHIINTLKECDNELYKDIENILQNKPNQKIKTKEEVLNLLNSLKEHIENNKEFTIIDYQNITNVSLIDMKKSLNNLEISNEDKKIIQTFISKILRSKPLKISQILSIKTTLQDKNGNLITPSTEEIENIIKFMEENNIPLLTKTYNPILKLYINGELDINQTKNRKN